MTSEPSSSSQLLFSTFVGTKWFFQLPKLTEHWLVYKHTCNIEKFEYKFTYVKNIELKHLYIKKLEGYIKYPLTIKFVIWLPINFEEDEVDYTKN